jgi:predicted aconitase with swiveling domain
MERESLRAVFHGRKISKGTGEGVALVTRMPISFYGGVDPEKGLVIEKGHELEGVRIKGRVLIFPHGKGSTVGSWTLLSLVDCGNGPSAIVNVQADPIIAVGAIIGNIPLVDKPDRDLFETIHSGDWIKVNGDEGKIEIFGESIK